ncbi:MAG TPA: arsinothricin resistance N-acetyltransferase ArsN1 family B [Solimonas sp.]|nr:arsinothricin resistance N-acetyltransferase ArsN1 family B [Solimonas sp.]
MDPTIRIADASTDAAGIAAVYAPHVERHFTSFELAAPDAATMAQRVEQTLARFPWLVAAQGTEVLGYAYAASHRERQAYQWCTDIAVYLRDDAQRRGLGRKLYGALFELLRRQGYVNAYAGIALPNPASVALHEALGFGLIGVYRETGYKHGAWRDVGWWQCRLQALPTKPVPPTPFAVLRGDGRTRDLVEG